MLLSSSKTNRFALQKITFLLCATALHVLLIPVLWSASEVVQHRAYKQRATVRVNILPTNPELLAQSVPESKTEELVEPSDAIMPTPESSSLDQSIFGASVENKHYFKSTEVTQRAQVVIDLPANFSAFEIGDLAQSLHLILHINDAGDIDDVIFTKDDISENTRRHIVDAFKLLKFRPAAIGHIPVASEMHIEILGGTLP